MGRQEIVAVARACRDVAVHDEEAGALQVHVGIDINEGIAAQLHAALGILLDGKLVELRTEVGSVVLGEEADVAAYLEGQLTDHHELQVEVAEEVEGGQRQHLLVAGVLVGDHVLPVEDAQAEVLLELGGEHVDAAALLHDAGCDTLAQGIGGVVAHAEVGVVLDFLDGHAQLRLGLGIAEQSLYADTCLVAQVIVIPPDVLRVVVALIERWGEPVQVGAGSQSDGVAEEREVDVGAEIKAEPSGIGTGHPGLGSKVVVKGMSLCLDDLSANADGMLVPASHGGVVLPGDGVGHFKASVLVGGKDLEACLGIFIEAFQQGDGHCVLE